MDLPPRLGLYLGLAGLTACTLTYAFSALSRNPFFTVLLLTLWVSYILIDSTINIYSRRNRLWPHLILGLLVATLPTTYMMGYASVYQVNGTVVSAVRTFSPSNNSATLTVVFDVYSSFNPIPVSVPDLSLSLYDLNPSTIRHTCWPPGPGCGDVGSKSLLQGGVILPFSHLRHTLTFTVPATFTDDFRGNTTWLALNARDYALVSSGFSSRQCNLSFWGHWDWYRNTGVRDYISDCFRLAGNAPGD